MWLRVSHTVDSPEENDRALAHGHMKRVRGFQMVVFLACLSRTVAAVAVAVVEDMDGVEVVVSRRFASSFDSG